MNILLGNFAGVGCNLLKYLTWCLIKKDEDNVLFFYANKPDNDNPLILPFHHPPNYATSIHIYNDRDRNIFYKLFDLPEGCSEEQLYKPNIMEMHFPNYMSIGRYNDYNFKKFPELFLNYENNFIFCPKLFKDKNLQTAREIYNSLWKKYLILGPSLKKLISNDLQQIKKIKEDGKRILAVFIRTPVHFISKDGKNSYEFEEMLDEIKEEMKNFDYLLPFTQVMPYYQILKDTFKDKIISLDRKRFNDLKDWSQFSYTDEEFYIEVSTAIVDIYLACVCDMVIGGMSNLFICTLFLNSVIPFKIFRCLEDKEGN